MHSYRQTEIPRKKIISQLRNFCPEQKTFSSENISSSSASKTKDGGALYGAYLALDKAQSFSLTDLQLTL